MKYFLPTTAVEALKLAQNHPDYRYYAGGTDLQLRIKQRLSRPETIIDLSRIAELRQVQFQPNGGLKLGALVTLSELTAHPAIRDQFPLIYEAAKSIGSPVLRKTATLGGNLLLANRCTFYNQSLDWRNSMGSCLRDTGDICQVTGVDGNCYSRNASDLAPALIALEAGVSIRGKNGTRQAALESLYHSDGIHYHQNLACGDLITEIRVPVSNGVHFYKKLRVRQALDYSSLTIAAIFQPADHFRVCVNGVSMSPVWLEGFRGEMTFGAVEHFFRKHCQTVDNDTLPREYRRLMMVTWLREWWESAAG